MVSEHSKVFLGTLGSSLQCISHYLRHDAPVTALAWSPCGTMLVAGIGQQLQVYHPEAHREGFRVVVEVCGPP